MATYAEIERDRQAHKYVIYDFFDTPDPDIPDEYNVNNLWCKYYVGSPNGGLNRIETLQKRLKQYNYYSDDAYNQKMLSFKDIEKSLVKKGYRSIDYFKRLCTINIRGDETCELMLTAGARINFDQLKNDIDNAKNDAEISNILHRLTGQVNAAALNGSFTKFFSAIFHIEDSNAPIKKYDDVISDFYDKTIKGGTNIKAPIEIPTDPQVHFFVPHQMVKDLNEIEKSEIKPDSEITKTVISEIKSITTARLNNEKKFR